MERKSNDRTNIQNQMNDGSFPLDPLIEQMNSVLQLTPRMPAGTQPCRQRRFSDAEIPFAVPNMTQKGTVSTQNIDCRGADEDRWPPLPDRQSQVVRERPSIAKATNAETLSVNEIRPHLCIGIECAVIKVFETTELLELILTHLETDDVLSVRSTSRRWNLVSKESPRLRLHYFSKPQYARPAAQYDLLSLNLPGLMIENGKPLHLGRWIHVSLTREAARSLAPETQVRHRVRSRSIFEGLRGGLGSKKSSQNLLWPNPAPEFGSSPTLEYSKLLVTQPPLLGMQAFIISPRTQNPSHLTDDDTGSEDSPDIEPIACAKLSCDAGITMGFLAETAQSLLSSAQNIHGSGEEDDRFVLFKAIMSFSEVSTRERKIRTAKNVTRIG